MSKDKKVYRNSAVSLPIALSVNEKPNEKYLKQVTFNGNNSHETKSFNKNNTLIPRYKTVSLPLQSHYSKKSLYTNDDNSNNNKEDLAENNLSFNEYLKSLNDIENFKYKIVNKKFINSKIINAINTIRDEINRIESKVDMINNKINNQNYCNTKNEEENCYNVIYSVSGIESSICDDNSKSKDVYNEKIASKKVIHIVSETEKNHKSTINLLSDPRIRLLKDRNKNNVYNNNLILTVNTITEEKDVHFENTKERISTHDSMDNFNDEKSINKDNEDANNKMDKNNDEKESSIFNRKSIEKLSDDNIIRYNDIKSNGNDTTSMTNNYESSGNERTSKTNNFGRKQIKSNDNDENNKSDDIINIKGKSDDKIFDKIVDELIVDDSEKESIKSYINDKIKEEGLDSNEIKRFFGILYKIVRESKKNQIRKLSIASENDVFKNKSSLMKKSVEFDTNALNVNDESPEKYAINENLSKTDIRIEEDIRRSFERLRKFFSSYGLSDAKLQEDEDDDDETSDLTENDKSKKNSNDIIKTSKQDSTEESDNIEVNPEQSDGDTKNFKKSRRSKTGKIKWTWEINFRYTIPPCFDFIKFCDYKNQSKDSCNKKFKENCGC